MALAAAVQTSVHSTAATPQSSFPGSFAPSICHNTKVAELPTHTSP